MKKLLTAIIATIISAVCLFSACGETPSDPQTPSATVTGMGFNWFGMNTIASFVVYDDFSVQANKDKLELFSADAAKILSDIENSLSSTKKDSRVSAFNAAAAGAEVELDKISYEALATAKSVYDMTGGYYNPAVWYSVNAYGFNGGRAEPPQSPEELPPAADIEKYVDLSKHFGGLTLKEEEGKYYAVKPAYTVEVGGQTLSMKIDLGGVGKGYAADKIDGLFAEYGYTMGYFNFGSSSLAFKKYKDGGNITLACIDPRGQYDPISGQTEQFVTIPVADVCSSVSGDYENYFLLDADGDGVKERYCHIFDPTTGRPVQTGIMTVAVIGGSAAEDDALTTAIMAMGPERAKAFIAEKLTGRRVLFTYETPSGSFYHTNIPQGGYTLLNGRYAADGAEDVA